MSPLRYAGESALTDPAAIDLFLRATHAGVLDFTWAVLCPLCSSFLTTAAGLRSLTERKRCSLCQADVALTDDAVEIAFTVSEPVRKLRISDPETIDFQKNWMLHQFSRSAVPDREHAEIFKRPPIASRRLGPGETWTLEVTLEPKRYAVIAPVNHATAHFEARAPGGASEVEVHFAAGYFVPEEIAVHPGKAKIQFHNRGDRPMVMGFLHDPVPEAPANRAHLKSIPVVRLPYLTGKRLVTSQTFRELFRAESMPSQDGLQFKSLTLLFTDLKGSTEMYERVGDFKAFALVREHFRVLRDLVAENGGAVVKTIGDAIMASFAEPAPAVAAAARMRDEVRRVGEGGALELKLGLHAGPCIAVESNERLDYFGQTVNIAARVQGVASANEIACTDAVFDAPGVGDAIRAAKLSAADDRAVLKGVDGVVKLHRLR